MTKRNRRSDAEIEPGNTASTELPDARVGAAATPTTVAIVPHTHWDREWYAPFQTFRIRLVQLFDQLLPMLEQDLSYARFLLDGQTAVLDDYLDVRPAAAATISRLAASGRLQVGPWTILMDEFMVSGETMNSSMRIVQGPTCSRPLAASLEIVAAAAGRTSR